MARAAREVRIAFDARETSHMSQGVLAYSRALRRHLPAVAPDLAIVAVGRGDNFDLAEQVGLPLELARSGAALVHFPTLYVPRIVPIPAIVTIHDLIDLHYPQYGKAKVGPYLRAVVAPVARAARCVITDDLATVADLERFFGVDPRRVRVVALGSDARGDAVPKEHPRPYLLYVTNRRPHKNIATLVRAWEALPATTAVDLVLSGDDDGSVRGSRSAGAIVHLGHVADADLSRWYAGAAAYVHPALREGFGLPLLEAMRHGTPVIASRAATPAILAPHATLVDAEEVDAWCDAITAALDDPVGSRAAGAAARAATAALTWERTARETAAVYRDALR
jgi:glycosyltransferase involved in cell wall biosynthesis